eukprot:2735092-Lingulodinium_polyedra.AAC.1
MSLLLLLQLANSWSLTLASLLLLLQLLQSAASSLQLLSPGAAGACRRRRCGRRPARAGTTAG